MRALRSAFTHGVPENGLQGVRAPAARGGADAAPRTMKPPRGERDPPSADDVRARTSTPQSAVTAGSTRSRRGSSGTGSGRSGRTTSDPAGVVVRARHRSRLCPRSASVRSTEAGQLHHPGREAHNHQRVRSLEGQRRRGRDRGRARSPLCPTARCRQRRQSGQRAYRRAMARTRFGRGPNGTVTSPFYIGYDGLADSGEDRDILRPSPATTSRESESVLNGPPSTHRKDSGFSG